MNTNKILIAVSIALILISGILIFNKKGGTTIVERIGANPSQAEITGTDTFIVNGIKYINRSCVWKAATTTPCTIPVPTGTSTLVFLSNDINVATSTGLVFDISTSTTGFATSSDATAIIGNRTVAANAKDSIFAGTTTDRLSMNALTREITMTSNTGSASASKFIIVKTGVGLGGFTVGAVMKAVFMVSGN